MLKQAILKAGFAGKKQDALERLELAADILFSTDSGSIKEIRELSAFMESEINWISKNLQSSFAITRYLLY